MDRGVEEIRRRARERVAGRESMVMGGDVIEELARAHERHAQRVRDAARPLLETAWGNHLGDTFEGRAATAHVRASASEGPESLLNSMMTNARVAEAIADGLRRTGAALKGSDDSSAVCIERS